jgi:hypothetical protein
MFTANIRMKKSSSLRLWGYVERRSQITNLEIFKLKVLRIQIAWDRKMYMESYY